MIVYVGPVLVLPKTVVILKAEGQVRQDTSHPPLPKAMMPARTLPGTLAKQPTAAPKTSAPPETSPQKVAANAGFIEYHLFSKSSRTAVAAGKLNSFHSADVDYGIRRLTEAARQTYLNNFPPKCFIYASILFSNS